MRWAFRAAASTARRSPIASPNHSSCALRWRAPAATSSPPCATRPGCCARAPSRCRSSWWWRRPTSRARWWSNCSPLEQQARQEREQRLLDQSQANKELVRNLAHEIRNPLGGIRGAAQLLETGGPGPGPEGVHPRHRARGRPAAGAGRSAAAAAPAPAAGGRRQHPRGLRAGALAGAGRVPHGACRWCATTTPRCRSSAATASS